MLGRKRRKRVTLVEVREDGRQVFETKRGDVFHISGPAGLLDPVVGEHAFLAFATGPGYGLWFPTRK